MWRHCMCYGGEKGDGQLWGSEDVVPLWCAMVWGRMTAIFGGVDVVPLLGAIAGWYCSAMVGEREGDGQLSRVDVVPLLGAIAVVVGGR